MFSSGVDDSPAAVCLGVVGTAAGGGVGEGCGGSCECVAGVVEGMAGWMGGGDDVGFEDRVGEAVDHWVQSY